MRPSTTPITMLCTVGGSHAPIVRAIRDSRPDFVWFICTDGPHGSITQIRGPGNCIKAHPRDEKPTLPNIPTQVGLREDQYDVLTVPPERLRSMSDHCELAFPISKRCYEENKG